MCSLRVECGLPAAGIGQVKREDERALYRLLYCLGKSPGQNGINHSHWTKYICTTTPAAGPRLINFLKSIPFMASDSSSGFRRGISHFFTATKKYNRESGRKNKRTIWTWVSSWRKKGSFM